MFALNPTAHLAEALINAGEYSRSQHPAKADENRKWSGAAPAFTIALSREVGARGTSVARAVGERLGWPVYDHELLEQLAEEMQVGVKQLENLDEKPGSWLQECIESFSAAPPVTESTYFRRLLRMLLALGARGECLIVGRGAAQLLAPVSTLRVRLTASREDRIAVISQEMQLAQPAAARYIDTRDRERIQFIKDHFQKDPTDPQQYDLILNTSRFSVAACAELIIDALHQLRHSPTHHASVQK